MVMNGDLQRRLSSYYLNSLNSFLNGFRHYFCDAAPTIFENDLEDFFVLSIGGKNNNIKSASFVLLPPLKKDSWNIWYEGSKSSRDKLSIEERTTLFTKWFREQDDKKSVATKLMDYYDVNAACNVLIALETSPILVDVFCKNTSTSKDKIHDLKVLADKGVKAARKVFAHLDNELEQDTLNHEFYVETIQMFIQLYSYVYNANFDEEYNKNVNELKKLYEVALTKSLSFSEIHRYYPQLNLSLLQFYKDGLLTDYENKCIYYTSMDDIKSLSEATYKEQKQVEEVTKTLHLNGGNIEELKSIVPTYKENSPLSSLQENILLKNSLVFFEPDCWTNSMTLNKILEYATKLQSLGNAISVGFSWRNSIQKQAQGLSGDDPLYVVNSRLSTLHRLNQVIYFSSSFVGDYKEEPLYLAGLLNKIKFVLVTTPRNKKYLEEKIQESGLNNVLIMTLSPKGLVTPSKTSFLRFCGGIMVSDDVQPTKPQKPLKMASNEVKKVSNGDIVTTQNKKEYVLVNKLAEGGEGAIYQTNVDGVVAKIYFENSLDDTKYNKLKEMVNISGNLSNVCVPEELLFKDGKFVGFTMKQVPPTFDTLTKTIFQLGKPSMQATYPKWTRLSLVSSCIAICIGFDHLHKSGILMGDVNSDNILIDMSNYEKPSIYFVDCDSMQYGDFNCPVGQESYTDPRIYKLYGESPKFIDVKRTMDNELYAITVLLFKVLFFGYSPYISKKNIDIKKAMIDYNFAYRSKNSDGADTPEENRLIWNNTPRYIKDAFEEVFVNKGYVTLKQWVALLKNYRKDISDNKYSNELYPALYMDTSDHKYMHYFTCEECGNVGNMPKERYAKITEHNPNPLMLCKSCSIKYDKLCNMDINDSNDRKFDRSVVCCKCGKQTKYPTYKDAYLSRRNHKEDSYICEDCLTVERVKCSKCGNIYEDRKWHLDMLHKKNQSPICRDCMQPVNARCSSCGKIIKTQKWRADSISKKVYCDECRSKW